jgi:serine/threonine-protein kinase RsbT
MVMARLAGLPVGNTSYVASTMSHQSSGRRCEGERVAGRMAIRISGVDDVVVARDAGRSLAVRAGQSASQVTEVVTAISEVARNIAVYAGSGWVRIRLIERGDRSGVRVVAIDKGPGIKDLGRALQDGYSTGGGLGLGLPGARRLMDEFAIRSAQGRGTRVTMLKWGRHRF